MPAEGPRFCCCCARCLLPPRLLLLPLFLCPPLARPSTLPRALPARPATECYAWPGIAEKAPGPLALAREGRSQIHLAPCSVPDIRRRVFPNTPVLGSRFEQSSAVHFRLPSSLLPSSSPLLLPLVCCLFHLRLLWYAALCCCVRDLAFAVPRAGPHRRHRLETGN